jgi:hypothetical protein
MISASKSGIITCRSMVCKKITVTVNVPAMDVITSINGGKTKQNKKSKSLFGYVSKWFNRVNVNISALFGSSSVANRKKQESSKKKVGVSLVGSKDSSSMRIQKVTIKINSHLVIS